MSEAWIEFAAEFEKREGFAPNPRDSRAKELFTWFKSGTIWRKPEPLPEPPKEKS